MEILIYITCFVVIAYIVYSVLRIKSKSPGDDILSSFGDIADSEPKFFKKDFSLL